MKRELKEGDHIEIDVRDRFFASPVWVPAIFVRHEPGDKTSSWGDMLVRIDAPEGHPWHRHNDGPLHLCPRHGWWRERTTEDPQRLEENR